MIEKSIVERVEKLLIYQLRNWWGDFNEDVIINSIPAALVQMEQNYTAMPSGRFCNGGKMVFDPLFSVTWMIFLYRISRVLYQGGHSYEADCVYYLNKIMHSNDWFYQIALPTHFMAEHPLGCVLGKAEYGDYLFVYQGTTVGGNRKDGVIYYPVLGNNVVMYANSTILGKTIIGNNVIISANSYLINEIIPDNSIVFGKSPNIVIKSKSEDRIKSMTGVFWMW